MSNDIKVEIPSLPLNKTHKRLYPASSDPTFEHATYDDMVKYLTNKTSYFGQIIYCKDDDKLYKISKGESGQKVLRETTITTSENINYSNSELSGVTNVKTAIDNVLTKSKENKDAIGTIDSKVDNIKTDLDNVINSNNGNNTAIENLNNQVENINTNVSNVTNQVETINTNIGNITNDVNSNIEKTNQNKEAIGTIKTDTSNINTKLSVIEKLLLAKFPTNYTNPSLSVTSKKGLVFELGSTITPTIAATFTKNDAGNVIKYRLLKDGQKVYESSSVQEFTDTQFVLNNSVEYTAEVQHEAGEVKKDSLGRPSSSGQILAGTISKSINITTARASWGFVSDSPNVPTRQIIRDAVVTAINLRKGSTIRAIAQSTSRIVIFAYPADLGECAKIRYEESGDDNNKTAFTPITLQIPDKSGNNLIDYKVYYYIPKVQFGATATFTLTI